MKLTPIVVAATLAVLLARASIADDAPEDAGDGWPVAAPSNAGMDAARLDALAAAVDAGEFQRLRAVVLARGGSLVFERYYNGADRDARTNVRSASKSVTSALIGVAIDRGEIAGVDARILELLPGYADRAAREPRLAEITVEDFLTMSSSLECDDWNEFSRGNEERMYLVEDWVGFAFDLPIRGFPPWTTRPEASPYGRAFSYCTAGAFALGAALEAATGAQIEDYAEAHLFGPIGLVGQEWPQAPSGQAITGGGLDMRARDMVRFGQLYLDGGSWRGTRVLSEDWVRQSFEPRAELDDETLYGYLWWIRDFEIESEVRRAYYASGNGGNEIFVVPDLDLVVAIAATAYNQPYQHDQAMRMMANYVLPAVVGPPEASP
jgi:CubicO group peptidase (beta-lactamase class C family)